MSVLTATYDYTLLNDGTYEIKCNNKDECVEAIIPDVNPADNIKITSIGENAFQGCSELITVFIGNNITTIKGNAFYRCKKLENISIGDNVITLGSYVFSDCNLLKWNTKNELRYLGNEHSPYNYLFMPVNSKTIEDVIIEPTCKLIAPWAFAGCASLKRIVTFEDAKIILSSYVFRGCSNLEEINLNGEFIINGSAHFENCTSLKNIKLPLKFPSINTYMFKGCTSLTDVVINDNVKKIDNQAFGDCTSLKNIILIPSTPPTLNQAAFSNGLASGFKFYCTTAASNAYKNATNWKVYANDIITDNLRIYFILNSYAQKKYFVSKEEIKEKVDIKNIATINGQSITSGGNIEIGSGITVDTELSVESENPVQNKVVTEALSGKLDKFAATLIPEPNNFYLYGRNYLGKDTYIHATNYNLTTKHTLPMRSTSGNLRIPNFKEGQNDGLPDGEKAVNKNYVDNAIANIASPKFYKHHICFKLLHETAGVFDCSIDVLSTTSTALTTWGSLENTIVVNASVPYLIDGITGEMSILSDDYGYFIGGSGYYGAFDVDDEPCIIMGCKFFHTYPRYVYDFKLDFGHGDIDNVNVSAHLGFNFTDSFISDTVTEL